ncbi:biopolymer transporter ExbD [Dyella terrae]|uniref:Biopolymer transporter ExbD n=2 Tax=Dyella TaxID=231454 RepID=A0A4R0Z2V5_9GAMM|nr:biopolymer transporter ExbD [Dyella terrae]TCI13808.1 biopolymer transporter ExbD [Dyella soli]
MANINVTPLVDVLLVLLIIFMITAPVITHRTRIDLPTPNRTTTVDDAERVPLQIRANGSVYWNGTPVDADQLRAQMAVLAHMSGDAVLVLSSDDGTPYDDFARVLAMARQQGLGRFDFADQP